MKHIPYYFQNEALSAFGEFYNSIDSGNGLIVLPTGTGKSLLQAMIADYMITRYPEKRILFLTHQPTLIEQNFNELIMNLGITDAGIYCAKFNSRDTMNQILFASIQSVYKKALEIGRFDLIVIDEAHLISPNNETMYRKFFDDMIKQSLGCRMLGVTATPYRMTTGLLTEGDNKIFDEIIYEYPLYKAIKEGYVCKPIGKAGAIRPDTSKVKKRGGEFVEKDLAEVCDNDIIIKKAVSEIIELTHNRKHVLIFCVGIKHAEHVADEIKLQGEDCRAIHSKLSDQEQKEITDNFKNGNLKYVANVDMWTTGFNYREIDCIVMLRPTMSTGLYVQMCGRGFRTFPGKDDFLLLDYAGNILTHGPLDKIYVETKGFKENRGVQTAPMKECAGCGQPIPLSTVICKLCGYEYPVNVGHGTEAANVDPISKYKPPEEVTLEYDDTSFSLHESKNGKISMRVSYSIGILQSVSEYICIEHGGYAEQMARKWLRQSLPDGCPLPDTVEECLQLKNMYKRPCAIFIDYNQRFPRIISRIFPDIQEEKKEEIIIEKKFVR